MKRRFSCWLMVVGLLAPLAQAHLPTAGGDDHHDHANTVVHDLPGELQRGAYARQRIEAFRVSGDDRELARAWLYLEQDLKREAPAYETLIVAAFIVQAQHRFDLALRYLERAQEQQAHTDEAWLLKASLHLLAGEAADALAACRSLSVSVMQVRLFCAGRVASLEQADASRTYRQLAPLVVLFGEEPELAAWALSVLGDLAVAAGLRAEAIEHYQASLNHADRSQVRAALIDQLLIGGRWHEAWRHLQSPGQSLALHVRRFIVAGRIGETASVAADVAQADQSFREWIARGDWLHAREMSRFYLDVVPQPYLANRLARINFMLQKEPEDQRLLQRTL